MSEHDFKIPYIKAIEFAHSLKSLNREQFNWQFDRRKWSIGQIISHLNLTLEKFMPHLDKSLDEAIESGKYELVNNLSYDFNFVERTFNKFAGPEGSKIPAPSLTTPKEEVYELAILDQFIELQNQLMERIDRSEGLDISKIKARSSISPLIKMKLPAWFEGLAGHQVRHFKQIDAIKAKDNFPA